MSRQAQGRPPRAPAAVQNGGHLSQKSWESDDWQKLLTNHFGGDSEVPTIAEFSPLSRLTSDGNLLNELLQTLDRGDPDGIADPNAPLFSDETINAILGEQLRETAAQVASEFSDQPHRSHQEASSDALQNTFSGQSTSSMMSLKEATAAMQTVHATQPLPLPIPALHMQQQQTSLPTLGSSVVITTQTQHMQPIHHQYVTLVSSDSGSILQYLPIMNGQVVQAAPSQQGHHHYGSTVTTTSTSPNERNVVLATLLQQQQQPATSTGTPPVTTPTSAAAASAAIYTGEISTTQQLVAAAAAQQQLLKQEAAAVACTASNVSAPEAALAAMRQAAAAMADISGPMLTQAHSGPASLGMPPPPPRPPKQNQQPTLTPQLRPAMATTQPIMMPVLRPVAVNPDETFIGQMQQQVQQHVQQQQYSPPEDAELPRKPCHKRERSLRSASPTLADPTTAPTHKYPKGVDTVNTNITTTVTVNNTNNNYNHDNNNNNNNSTVVEWFATSPDSCILANTVAGSSGDLSPLNAHAAVQQPSALPEPPAVDPEVIAAMQAALGPKPGSKRRGRPPGRTINAALAGHNPNEPKEPTDIEIVEHLLREDPARRDLPLDEIKKLVRKEKNRISAAISRSRSQQYTVELEKKIRALQAEQAELAGWLRHPPQAPPHRVLLGVSTTSNTGEYGNHNYDNSGTNIQQQSTTAAPASSATNAPQSGVGANHAPTNGNVALNNNSNNSINCNGPRPPVRHLSL